MLEHYLGLEGWPHSSDSESFYRGPKFSFQHSCQEVDKFKGTQSPLLVSVGICSICITIKKQRNQKKETNKKHTPSCHPFTRLHYNRNKYKHNTHTGILSNALSLHQPWSALTLLEEDNGQWLRLLTPQCQGKAVPRHRLGITWE